MFRAVRRYLKALGYLLTGRIDEARKTLEVNPYVMRAKFDAILEERTERIHQYVEAVSMLISQRENKVATIKKLIAEAEKLEYLKTGALAMAKKRVSELKKQGKEKEEIEKDLDYQKCLSSYNDFSSTLAEKQARIAELEKDVKTATKTIDEHKVQLQGLKRGLDNLKAEAAETVADVITATQEREIAESLANIARDGTAQELQDLRELRQEMRARATVTRELAGIDTAAQEAEFLQEARESVASEEFVKAVGLEVEEARTEEKKGGEEEKRERKTQLPED